MPQVVKMKVLNLQKLAGLGEPPADCTAVEWKDAIVFPWHRHGNFQGGLAFLYPGIGCWSGIKCTIVPKDTLAISFHFNLCKVGDRPVTSPAFNNVCHGPTFLKKDQHMLGQCAGTGKNKQV